MLDHQAKFVIAHLAVAAMRIETITVSEDVVNLAMILLRPDSSKILV
jgi:hypothetical protein